MDKITPGQERVLRRSRIRVAYALRQLFPKLTVANCLHIYDTTVERPEMLRRLRLSEPAFVAFASVECAKRAAKFRKSKRLPMGQLVPLGE